jgi:hypothetical protein
MFRPLRRSAGAVLVLAAALMAASCESETPIEPEPPDPVTDTFTGNLARNGAATFPFTVSAAGSITASIVTLDPNSSAIVGLSLGTWNGTACNIVIANDNASQGTVVLGQTTSGGSLCVRISDVGKLTDPVNYTITVVHP